MSSDTLANSLFSTLTAGTALTLPAVDLSAAEYALPDGTGPAYELFERLTNADLTTGEIGGSGTFDQMMLAFRAHLEKEYAANRISGAEYTKAYAALTAQAMQTAAQYLLGRDTAYFQALSTQLQAQTAQVQLVQARVALQTAMASLQAQRFEALTSEANYALTKLKLATESANYDAAAYQVSDILPQQKKMVTEQAESARAQTLETRSDGLPVAGSIGQQKQLYAQQVISYKRDAETKAARMFLDAFITMFTVNDTLDIPDNFKKADIDIVFNDLRTNLGLV